MIVSSVFHLVLYLAYVAIDGDYLNDYLVDLPLWLAPIAQLAGMALSLVLGYPL